MADASRLAPKVGTPDVFQTLSRIVNDDSSASVRLQSLVALRTNGGPNLEPVLVRCLDDERDSRVIALACRALAGHEL